MKKLLAICCLFFYTVLAVAQKTAFGTRDYIRALKHATDIMVNDVTTPVAASRYYSYITLSANEAACQFKHDQVRVGGKLREYAIPQIPREMMAASDASLSIIFSIYQAGVRFLPSGYLLKPRLDSLKNVASKRKISKQKVDASFAVATAVVNAAVNYAYTDGFTKLSGLRRFTPASGDEYWQPTPPGFMAAIEPNWSTLRPFILDSVSQISIVPPLKYNPDTTSEFYKQMLEVYETSTKNDAKSAAAAMYWDCNPFALQQVGHLEFGIKKISPGGHWIGITGIACTKAKYDLYKTAFVHSLVSASMADAFISCWNTKYKFNRVRPETAIKKLKDPSWKPLLQTPPFPEYTSGHSVVSAVCSAILTQVFGENFSFTDNTEVEFGLPRRKFRSFNEAAEEAAMSRLYGGIHFRDAVENGRKEGEQIASIIISKYKGELTGKANR
jgi:hypothetical protein